MPNLTMGMHAHVDILVSFTLIMMDSKTEMNFFQSIFQTTKWIFDET